MNRAIERELRQHLNRLVPDQQRRVLEFARTLAAPTIPGSGRIEHGGAARDGIAGGCKDAGPEAFLQGAIVRVHFGGVGRIKDRKFNSSLQQVPLRRTGRPVFGSSGRGSDERVRADPGGVSGGCRGSGVTDRRRPRAAGVCAEPGGLA